MDDEFRTALELATLLYDDRSPKTVHLVHQTAGSLVELGLAERVKKYGPDRRAAIKRLVWYRTTPEGEETKSHGVAR